MIVLRLLGAALAMLLFAGCSMDGSSSSSGGGSASIGSVGQPVRDGKLEFVVKRVDTSTPGLVKVDVSVTNIGDKSQYWSSGAQKLLAGGKEFDSDLFEGSAGMEDLNPGLGVDAVLGFKVPPGTAPEAIELHDSMFSQGVKVEL